VGVQRVFLAYLNKSRMGVIQNLLLARCASAHVSESQASKDKFASFLATHRFEILYEFVYRYRCQTFLMPGQRGREWRDRARYRLTDAAEGERGSNTTIRPLKFSSLGSISLSE